MACPDTLLGGRDRSSLVLPRRPQLTFDQQAEATTQTDCQKAVRYSLVW